MSPCPFLCGLESQAARSAPFRSTVGRASHVPCWVHHKLEVHRGPETEADPPGCFLTFWRTSERRTRLPVSQCLAAAAVVAALALPVAVAVAVAVVAVVAVVAAAQFQEGGGLAAAAAAAAAGPGEADPLVSAFPWTQTGGGKRRFPRGQPPSPAAAPAAAAEAKEQRPAARARPKAQRVVSTS